MPTAVCATSTPMVGSASFTSVETIGPFSMASRARALRSAPVGRDFVGGVDAAGTI